MYGLRPYTSVGAFDAFKNMRELEKRFFGDSDDYMFKTDIHDNGNEYVLEAEMPGYKRENIHIDTQGDYLTISAENEQENENSKYLYKERSYGSYSRTYNIQNVDKESITAQYKDGVLYVTMPKKEEKTEYERHIEIR